MNSFEGKAPIVGLLAAAAVVVGVYLGSHGLRHFDPAVAGYALGAVLAAFAVGYRFTVWVQRPPSRMYFKRGLQLLLRRNSKLQLSHFKSPAPAVELSKSLVTNFAAQRFINAAASTGGSCIFVFRAVVRWRLQLPFPSYSVGFISKPLPTMPRCIARSCSVSQWTNSVSIARKQR